MVNKVLGFLGVVFLIVGVWGFFQNPILGYFEVDMVHNVVHLVTGLLALYFAGKSPEAAGNFALIFGVVYALVAVLGFTMGSPVLGFLAVNGADNYLHAAFAVVFIIVGMMK